MPESKAASPVLTEVEAVLIAAEEIEAGLSTDSAKLALREASRRAFAPAAEDDSRRDRERAERRRSALLWRSTVDAAGSMLGAA